MNDTEFEKGCDKLGELVKELEACESMLNELLPGDGEYEYYQTKYTALSFMVERLYKKLWAEVVDRSPQD